MEMAWNVDSIQANSIPHFLDNLAAQLFDSHLRQNIVTVWHEYDRLVRLRKHEHIDPETFSLLHYNEADEIATRWQLLLSTAETIHQNASDEQKAAIFELVLHPVKASTIFTHLRIAQARNQLHARQRRNSANKLLREILDLFDSDFKLTREFHSLLNGKWNHILSQPHLGYGETWHAPSRDAIFGLAYVQRNQDSNPIVGQLGVAVEGHEGVRAGRINEESERTHPSRRDLVPGLTLGPSTRYGPNSRWFDLFTRGTGIIRWSASAPYAWIQLSKVEGTLFPDGDDVRVWVTVDWERVPDEFSEEVLITVVSKEGDFEYVHLPVCGRRTPGSFCGFVEADGCMSVPASGVPLRPPYEHHPELGRGSEGAVTIDGLVPKSDVPFLEYPVYIFSSTVPASVTLYFNMTLDIDPADKMSYEIGVDDQSTEMHYLLPDTGGNKSKLPAEGWLDAVMDCVWTRQHVASFEAGAHTLRIRLNHPNLLLEKIVVDLGGVKESYRGPPPSRWVSG